MNRRMADTEKHSDSKNSKSAIVKNLQLPVLYIGPKHNYILRSQDSEKEIKSMKSSSPSRPISQTNYRTSTPAKLH